MRDLTAMRRLTSPAPPYGSGDPAQYEQIPPLDVAGMLRVLWHGKGVIALGSALAVVCGMIYAFEMTGPQFAATATLQVDARQAHLGDVSDQWETPATDPASLNTEVTILTSDSILLQVIAEQNLLDDPEFNRYLTPLSPFALNSIRGQVRQFLSGMKDVPPDAAAITQKTVQNLRGRLSAQRPRDTYLFQITAHSRDPDKAAAIANSAATAYIAAQIDAQDEAADAAIAWLSKRVAALRTQLEGQENAVSDMIATVQVQEETALDMLSATVLAVDEERATVVASLAIYDRATATSAREVAAIAQLRNQIAEIDARRARLHGQLAWQSTGIVALQQMQREANATRVLYQSFLARLQETQVQRGLVYPDSRLVTPATAGHYVGPQKTLLVGAAGLLGALLGLAFVAAQHITRKGVFHPRDLRQKTGYPVFASLPERRLHRGVKQRADQPFTPEMRKVRAGLLQVTGLVIPQVIMVTSSTRDEGATALAVALAQSAVADGRSTLLLLTDPENGEIERLLGASESHPSAHADGAVSYPALGLEVMPDHCTKNVLSADFAQQLDSLRERFECIVLLAPPVLVAPETQLLVHGADAVTYAVRWAKTPLPAVQRGLEILEQGAEKPTGLVLTRTHLRKMRRFAAVAGVPIPELEMA